MNETAVTSGDAVVTTQEGATAWRLTGDGQVQLPPMLLSGIPSSSKVSKHIKASKNHSKHVKTFRNYSYSKSFYLVLFF